VWRKKRGLLGKEGKAQVLEASDNMRRREFYVRKEKGKSPPGTPVTDGHQITPKEGPRLKGKRKKG